ncbi:hypothetical protein PFISCL1PPCAC_16911, partial [Pristionchus fissidentatus]
MRIPTLTLLKLIKEEAMIRCSMSSLWSSCRELPCAQLCSSFTCASASRAVKRTRAERVRPLRTIRKRRAKRAVRREEIRLNRRTIHRKRKRKRLRRRRKKSKKEEAIGMEDDPEMPEHQMSLANSSLPLTAALAVIPPANPNVM